MISKHSMLFLLSSLFFINTCAKPKRTHHNTSLTPTLHTHKSNNNKIFKPYATKNIEKSIKQAITDELKLTSISLIASYVFIRACIMFDTNKS